MHRRHHLHVAQAGGIQTALFYNLDVKRDATASVTLGALQDNGIVTTRRRRRPDLEDGRRRRRLRRRARRAEREARPMGGATRRSFGSTNDGNSYGGITPPWSASESDSLPGSRRDRSKHGRRRVCEQQLRISGKAPTAGRRGRRRLRSPGPRMTVDVAPTNSNNVVVAVGGRVLVSTNALGALHPERTSRATCRAASSPASPSIRMTRQPSTPCSAGSAASGRARIPHDARCNDVDRHLTAARPSVQRDRPRRERDAYDRSMPERTSACCAPSTAARTGACSTTSTSRARPCSTWCSTTGELRAATFGRGVFSFVKPTGPAIAVGLEDNLAFGTSARDRRII